MTSQLATFVDELRRSLPANQQNLLPNYTENDIVHTRPSFPLFPQLPRELQIAIWKFAFKIGPHASHPGFFICKASFLTTKLQALRIDNARHANRDLISTPYVFFRSKATGWRVPEVPQKRVPISGAPYEAFIMPNYCFCYANFCHQALFGLGDGVQMRKTTLLGQGSKSPYRVIVPWRSRLRGLIQACYMSRMAALEAWKGAGAGYVILARNNPAVWNGYGMLEEWAGESRNQMALDVVEKMIKQFERGRPKSKITDYFRPVSRQ